MIVDACFLIDLLAGDSAAAAKLRELSDAHLVVPTLSFTEVAWGLEPGGDAEQTFMEVMDRVSLASYDAEAAKHAVEVQRQLRSEGRPIGAVDAMITGIALSRDEPVLTRNVDEFSRTPVRVSPY